MSIHMRCTNTLCFTLLIFSCTLVAANDVEEITSTTNYGVDEQLQSATEGTTASERVGDQAQNHDSITEENMSTTTEISPNTEETEQQAFTDMALAKANKISEQIKSILTYYRKEGVVIVPNHKFLPEPLSIEDFQKKFSIGQMTFKNITISGLSNFTIEQINSDVDSMEIYILLHMKRLVVLGNYTLSTLFSSSSGPFNLTLLNVEAEGVAAIESAEEGYFQATDSNMDMSPAKMLANFSNSLIDSIVKSIGTNMLDSMKPQILQRVNSMIRNDVNKKLKEMSSKFAKEASPVSLAFAEGRRYVREHGYDPFNIEHEKFKIAGIVNVNITEFIVEGLSRFNRIGNLSLSLDRGVIQFGIHVMTGKLSGSCKWAGEAFGIIRSGKTNYTVDHLQVKASVNQSLDVTKKPQLENLDLHLGWVKVTMESPMTLNVMVEGVINAFPRIVKHLIVDTLEKPLREKIQEILNKIDVESFVDNNLPQLDNFISL